MGKVLKNIGKGGFKKKGRLERTCSEIYKDGSIV